MKIVEGLHVEEVGDGEYVDVVVVPGNVRIGRDAVTAKAFRGEMKKSLIWQPHGDNWMAGEIMRVLKKEMSDE